MKCFIKNLPNYIRSVASLLFLIAMYFTLLFSVIFIYLGARCVYNRYLHPLQHLQGPLLGSLTELSKLYFLISTHIPSFNLKLHETYGIQYGFL